MEILPYRSWQDTENAMAKSTHTFKQVSSPASMIRKQGHLSGA